MRVVSFTVYEPTCIHETEYLRVCYEQSYAQKLLNFQNTICVFSYLKLEFFQLNIKFFDEICKFHILLYELVESG